MVTPRTGKPVEVNALWYNALWIIAEFARLLGEAPERYEALAEQARAGFARFWNEEAGYCYDVLDGPGAPPSVPPAAAGGRTRRCAQTRSSPCRCPTAR